MPLVSLSNGLQCLRSLPSIASKGNSVFRADENNLGYLVKPTKKFSAAVCAQATGETNKQKITIGSGFDSTLSVKSQLTLIS